MNYKKFICLSLLACAACFSPLCLGAKKIAANKSNKKSNSVKEIKNKQDFDALIKNNNLVIAKFHSPTCPHCVAMAPIFEEISRNYPDVVFVSLSAFDKGNNVIFDDYGIHSYPTFVFFKSGKKESQISGSMPKNMLESKVKTLAKK